MSSKIEGIKARFEEVIKEKDHLLLGELFRGKNSKVKARLPSTSVMNKEEIYGREKDKTAILELLRAEASDVNVSVIPIVGMEGVGKTTVAQLIFNDASLEFDLKFWVYVGEDFDVHKMTKRILELEESGDEDLNLLQIKLKKTLSQKKFLIVLDDVENESYDHWTLFFRPLEAGAPGSRVVFTTRKESVWMMMGTTPAYSLKELSHDVCPSVFAHHALGATKSDGHLHLEEIGIEIGKICRGLPSAAKALGGLLRRCPNPDA